VLKEVLELTPDAEQIALVRNASPAANSEVIASRVLPKIIEYRNKN
jgi:hypothetical protein